MLTDTELDCLRAIYQRNPRLRLAGVSFADFAADPSILVKGEGVKGEGVDPRPLLPAQRFAAARIAAAWLLQAAYVAARVERRCERERLRMRSGAWVEPLHHHRWPLSQSDFGRRA
jgi:hypothetical protein